MANAGISFLTVVALTSCFLSVLNHLRYDALKKEHFQNENQIPTNDDHITSRNRRNVRSSSPNEKLFSNIGELKKFIREEVNQTITAIINDVLETRLLELSKGKNCKCPGPKGERGPKGEKGDTGLGLYPPMLKNESLDVTAEAGDDTVVRCKFFGNPLPKTHWKTHVSNSEVKEDIDYKMSVITTSLHIKNLTWRDGGNVSCYATNLLGNVNETGSITVHAPPLIYLPSKPVIGIIGTTVMFPECKVVSSSPVTITWQRGSLTFPKERTYNNNGILRISRLKVEDEGYYKCVATNYLGRRTKYIHLRARPFEFSTKSPFYIYRSNSSVTLSCAAYGLPGNIFGKWSNSIDGKVVPHTTKFQNVNELAITAVVNKTGKYKCSISNNGTTIESYTEVELFELQSSIMSREQIHKMGTWFRESNGIGEYKLCWSGSRHGYNTSEFYNRCGGKPNTISIFKGNRSTIFGGYTDIPWIRSNVKTSSNCGGYIYNTGVIKYPQTGSYGGGKDCLWHIAINGPIKLKFLMLDTEKGTSCKFDYVQILQSQLRLRTVRPYTRKSIYRNPYRSTNVEKFCGNKVPQEFFSYHGKLSVRFHSDTGVHGKGFSLLIIKEAEYRYSSESFVFTLTPEPIKLPVHNKDKAICHIGKHGVCFGDSELYYISKSVIHASIGKSYKSNMITSLSDGDDNIEDIEVHYKV